MFLVYLKANQAWVILWASAPLRLDGESMFFETREEAEAALARHGLAVEKAIGPGFRVRAAHPTVGSTGVAA